MSLVCRSSLLALALAACTPAASAPASPAPAAHTLVAAALDAMGGEAKLRAIHGIHYKSTGSWVSVEASPRPEPPWNVAYERTDEWLDFTRGAWRRTSDYLAMDDRGGRWQPFTVVASDGASAMAMAADGELKPGGPVYLGDAAEQVLYQPFRLVIAAADADDLRRDRDEVVAGQPTEVVAFHHHGWPVRLWLDARNHRLAAAEIVHDMPDDFFWRVRGDVLDRFEPTQWTLDASGVWFARQFNLTRNGIGYHTFVISELEVNAAPADKFAIPDAVRAAYRDNARGPGAATARGEQPVAEVAPGVWFAAAARGNALLVGQPAGAVVIDAPISEVYTGRVLDEVAHRWGKPAASVVLTDHFIPTLAGVREVAARGVAIRALDANVGFVDSLLAAPHTLAPDALARAGRRGHAQAVSARSTLGDGATRVELIPMRTALGERILLAWLPAARLLWTATALAVDADGHPGASRLAELDAVVAREQLEVDRVVGSQLAITPWANLHAR
jgi:hypothetical protein